MEAGIDSLLFWGSLSVALVIAGAVALPVNRWLIARGKGHVAVHKTGIHGGPPTRVVAAVAAVAAVFGTVVLTAEAIDGGDMAGHGESTSAEQEPVRGLAVSAGGMTVDLERTELPRGRNTEVAFRILGSDGRPVRDFETEHEQQMHLIVVRRDLTGFQHLHPRLDDGGTWRATTAIPEAGSYRVFADFSRDGAAHTLASDFAVDGEVDWQQLPAEANTAKTADGYEVEVAGGSAAAGREAELRFTVTRDGEPVAVERYLGAGGHLVALREGDLAYLHVHPTGGPGSGPVSFMTEFPTEGHYRLFLQFKHEGKVHTAAFTREVGRADHDAAKPDTEGGHHG
jgi:hypothetical protein